MDVKKIAVVGAGAMGSGIAQVAATAGFETALQDVDAAALARALGRIRKSLERVVASGKIKPEALEQTVARLKTTTSLEEACAGADFVVESVFENLELKKRVFAAIDAAAPKGAILASNTTQLSVTAMANATGRPDRVIGMHWFNPPPVMKLVEIVRGVSTSDETLAVTKALSERMGKTVVVCRDAAGFITSRALAAHLMECFRILEEGIASAKEIDDAVKLGLGYPMGPMELADYVGLDVLCHASEGLAEAYGDRFRPPQTLVKLVEAGHLGAKTGRGFYEHGKK